MGREEHRAAGVGALAQDGIELVGGARVEPHEGLVQHQKRRVVQERACEHELLAHAVGVGGDRLPEGVRELQARRELACAPPALLRAHAEDVRDQVQVLRAGEEVVNVGVVRHVGHEALGRHGLAPDVAAADADRAGRGRLRPTTERMSMVLPALLWPMKPQISPGATASERSLTATLPRYSFR